MAAPRTILERRAAAAQATKDHFAGKAFKLGRYDCAQMVAWHLRRIGQPVKVAKAGVYHSALGAKKALARLGWSNLMDAADANFPRIPWSMALVGDLVEIEAEDDHGIGAMGVVLGNGRVLVYHQDAKGAIVGELKEANAAWRVLPNPS